MNVMAYLQALAKKFFHKDELAEDMDEELRSHVALRADDLERSGLSRGGAERRARIELGGREKFKEESYPRWAGKSLKASFRIFGFRSGFCASLRDFCAPPC